MATKKSERSARTGDTAETTAFPVTLYHPDGRTAAALNQAEVDALASVGFTPTDPTFQEYPKWVYHAEEPARIVQTEAELEALGAGWSETPVDPNAPPPAEPPPVWSARGEKADKPADEHGR